MVILCLLPSNSYADLVYSPNGRLGYVVSERTNGITTIKEIGGGYHQVDTSAHNIRSAVSGARSNAPVPATVSRTVPAAKVAQNILGKLKVARLTPQGLIGGLILQEILNRLLEQGYTYDDSSGSFRREAAVLFCASSSGGCIATFEDVFVENKYAVYGTANKMPSRQEMQDKLCNQVTKHHFNFVDQDSVGDRTSCVLNADMNRLNVSFIAVKQIGFVKPGGLIKVYMMVSKREVGSAPLMVSDVESVITQMPDQAEKIVESAELQDSDWSEPSVHVLDGTIVNSQPFTDTDGKAKQATWHFYDCPFGTCVREVLTDRPDLQPNSPAAPAPDNSSSNGTDTAPGTGGQSGSQSGNQTGTEQPPPFDLCKEHPEILACQQMGQPDSGQFDDIKIPVVVDDTTWQEDVFLPSTGVCPEPKTFHVMGKPFQVSYQPLCRLMENVRFMVLIAFILMSAYVCFGSLRRE